MIDRYLAELSRHLKVGPLRRRRILAEVRSHLEEGGPDGVERFGDPAELAAHFNAVPAEPPARLTAAAVLLSGWLVFGAVQGLEDRIPHAPWPEGQAPGRVDELMSYATFSLVAAVALALLALVAPRTLRVGVALSAAALITAAACLLVAHSVERADYVAEQPPGWWPTTLAVIVLAPTLVATAATVRAALAR